MPILEPRRQPATTEPPRGLLSRPPTDATAVLGPADSGDRGLDMGEMLIRSAPPWLISMVTHLVLILILALVGFTDPIGVSTIVQVSYADREGEQLIDDRQKMGTDSEKSAETQLATGPVSTEDPLAAPPKVAISLDGMRIASQLTAPSIGISLSGRGKGARQALLSAYGGTSATESAVQLGLDWLKRKQRRDGRWVLEDTYSDGADGLPNPTAATAMALLAFQGNGNTHLEGEFKDVTSSGMKALLAMQDADGNFYASGSNHHRLYSQAMATIAVSELFGMTQDPKLRDPAQRALDYAVKIQAPDGRGGGGWRYEPGQDVDTSVTGWFVMALQSGRMGGLQVSEAALDKVSKYLDSVTQDGARYTYRPGERVKLSMTAEAILCRQYLGWKRDDSRMTQAMKYIGDNPIDWAELNVYYWYYATQVTHHAGGEDWRRWNDVMRRVLPQKQVKSGKDRGSWDPRGDPYGYQGGRLYCTCFCIYMLEVYYRHLPIYQHEMRATGVDDSAKP